MFGLIANTNTSVTAGAENAFTAVADPDWTATGGQFIFTGPVRHLAEIIVGASVKYGRYNVAEWNGRGRPNIFAVNRDANPTSPMFWDDFRSLVQMLPQNQQIQVLATNNLATGNEAETHLWKIGTADWSANLPPGLYDLVAHATATATPVIGSWVENVAITFDQLPLGGVYAVIGANVIGGNGLAWRLNFPRTRMYMGRRMRPGDVILPSFGSLPPEFASGAWGRWGVLGFFHTFELPQLDILGTAASSTTYDIFMKLRYMGSATSILDQLVASNY